jgi:hypothetical protein
MNSKKVNQYQTAIKAFKNGKNIVNTLKKLGVNKSDSIEIAYEIQAGSYTREFNNFHLERNKALHSIINKVATLNGVDTVDTVGVFGVGEAMNWIGYEGSINKLFGVELSFSRLQFAYKNLNKISGIKSFQLIKGDAKENIFNKNSFDIAITMHSLEPNGNKQGASILRNVVDSASKYVVMFEPDYKTAHKEMKERMIKNDYVRNISKELSKMNSIEIIDKFKLKKDANIDNVTTCWIIRKKSQNETVKNKLVCPFTNGELYEYPDVMYSPNAGLGYPKINDFLFINKKDAVFLGEMGKVIE